jgi:hypothetical protein
VLRQNLVRSLLLSALFCSYLVVSSYRIPSLYHLILSYISFEKAHGDNIRQQELEARRLKMELDKADRKNRAVARKSVGLALGGGRARADFSEATGTSNASMGE